MSKVFAMNVPVVTKTIVPEDVALAFERAGETTPSSTAPIPSNPRKPESPKTRFRRDERGERVTVYLPSDIVTALRVRCAKERRSVSDGVTVAVEAWARDA